MASPFTAALDLTGALDAAATTDEVGRQLFAALAPYGLRGLFAASFPRLPEDRLADIVDGLDLYTRMPVPGWLDSYYRRRLDDGNPVILAPGRRASPFRWSQPGFADLEGWAGLDLARDLGIEDGLAVPWHGPGGRFGVISLGFERFSFSAGEQRMLELAAMLAIVRMTEMTRTGAPSDTASLTTRERDCLSFVADGLSDVGIGEKLGISHTTAHAHVENAKRKLGARTRAQAVARLILLGLAWSPMPLLPQHDRDPAADQPSGRARSRPRAAGRKSS
ncbi:autoinducer binding domain-containing protein [Phreatobacter sp.]|uniref:autoinducer binding domain-containing protein n=1 Tax=Phreatobacter sp. TaxID=1966341 RepID=UPI003F719578